MYFVLSPGFGRGAPSCALVGLVGLVLAGSAACTPVPIANESDSESTTGSSSSSTTSDSTTHTTLSTTTTATTTGTSDTSTTSDTSSTTDTGTTTEDMPYCGDGIVDEELEEACDDGNADNTDGCTDTCELPACGDGYVQEGEECDDGNAVDDDGCTNECLLGYCGNGILEPGEQCDDGNADDGDGCSSACAMEWAVFVTSVGFKGDLGGIAGADEKCQAHADSDTSLAPAGKYLAWLSDETDESSPQARFPTGDPELDGAYKLVDGTLVATDWADLTDGEITSPIILDETGASVPNESVWSNTTALGERKGDNHCQSWSTVSGMSRGFLGLSSESSSQWSDLDDFGNTCNSQYRLYCVQVPEG